MAATVAVARLMAARREDIGEAKDDAVGDGEADAAASWTTVAEFTPSADLTTTVEPAKGTRGW
uniref:Uncharacterized protein n=1 Tax=Oryza rufipogon TaxID=4529 RepID=A0A0E0MX57_ORYRU